MLPGNLNAVSAFAGVPPEAMELSSASTPSHSPKKGKISQDGKAAALSPEGSTKKTEIEVIYAFLH